MKGIKLQRVFSLTLGEEYKAELEEWSLEYGCSTHRELFEVMVDGFRSWKNEGGESTLMEENRKLKEQVARLNNRPAPSPGPTATSSARSSSIAPDFNDPAFFIAKVPEMARDRVAQFKAEMWDEMDYTSNWEILKHCMKDWFARKAGNTLPVMLTPKLKGQIETHSREPLETGKASSVSHFVSQELIKHFDGLDKTGPKEKKKKSFWDDDE